MINLIINKWKTIKGIKKNLWYFEGFFKFVLYTIFKFLYTLKTLLQFRSYLFFKLT